VLAVERWGNGEWIRERESDAARWDIRGVSIERGVGIHLLHETESVHFLCYPFLLAGLLGNARADSP